MDVPTLLTAVRVEARPYQQRIITKAVELLTAGGLRSVLIESPTGSGKTVMGLLIARCLQETLGVRVGWVAMRRNLLAQAAMENVSRNLCVRAEYISMFDKDPPRGLDLLVVDEAQHDAASSMAHLHNIIQPRYILGLSATPFRADKVKLCFESVIRDAGIQRLIQDGYLSQYHHYTIPAFTPEAVAEFYCADRGRWGKTLVYFHTLQQCQRCVTLLRDRGASADIVTGSSDRDAQIDAFKAGRLDVLLNCMVLAEGFDCPELKTVFCRPSVKSLTIQMCGRAFRKHAAVPFKQIVQCQKTRWPIQRTAKAAQQFLWVDGGWRSLTVNDQIDAVTQRTLRALAHIEVKLPRCLQSQAARGERLSRRRDSA